MYWMKWEWKPERPNIIKSESSHFLFILKPKRQRDITANDVMKRVLLIIAFIFNALCIVISKAQNFDGTVTVQVKDGDHFTPNTTCKVAGSSNDNVAILEESRVNSSNIYGRDCSMSTSLSLTKPSLGKTTIIIGIYDEYGKQVGNEIRTIDKGYQHLSELYLTVKQPYDAYEKKYEPCGRYTLSILSASCEESRSPLNKPKATSNAEYVDLGLPSGTLWKNTNEPDTWCKDYYVTFLKYENALPTYEQWQELLDYCTWELEKDGVKITSTNGNSIFLEGEQRNYFANGVKEYYYTNCNHYPTSTLEKNWLYFSENGIKFDKSHKREGIRYTGPVRLVKPKQTVASFVDLGLPSGTKWKSQGEREFLTFNDAISKYKKQLPTSDQWKELISDCKWEDLGPIYKVIGKNGNYIIINKEGIYESSDTVNPSYIGDCAYFWSSTSHPSTNSYDHVVYDVLGIGYYTYAPYSMMLRYSSAIPSSIQLVQSKDVEEKYVDLGLPSGTKWKSQNEKGFFTYEEAFKKYGKQIPSKEQYQELIDNCQWKDEGGYFAVTGPNGKSIIINKEGWFDNEKLEINTWTIGRKATYWTNTSHFSKNIQYYSVCTLVLMTQDMTISAPMNHHNSVHLIK